jgi:hypothetical protein
MRKTYAWCCLACECSNAADQVRCTRCGCPAAATSAQIEASRDEYRRRSGLPAVVPVDVLGLVKQLPLLLIAAALLLLLGGFSLILSTNASMTAFAGLLMALSALCLSSWRPASAP